MFRGIVSKLTAQVNQARMAGWAAKIDSIVSTPPGCDDGFTAEEIERSGQTHFTKFSTWEIICEEVVDTEHSRLYYERAREELRRRGISDQEYEALRRFAWMTAGWLNFEKMLWDWCSLDEKEILRAIEWQYADGWITKQQRDRSIEYVERYVKPGETSQVEDTSTDQNPREA